jgi:hypothetical protein
MQQLWLIGEYDALPFRTIMQPINEITERTINQTINTVIEQLMNTHTT